ncbi:hypothetical protein HK104_001988 [Borealophlyctis nickersoniae]|nr:hypothetical protein HK104_001988 [Borealophlyctis nickersoniae]
MHGHGRIVGALQQAYPEEVVSFGWAALAVAAARGHTDLVKNLWPQIAVEKKSSNIPEIVSDLVDRLAVIMGNEPPGLYLLKRLNLNVKDYSIWLAAYQGHKEVVQLLIQAGANVDIDNMGWPLFTATGHGHTEVVQLLLDAGAEHGKATAFDVATYNGYTEIARLLIPAGLDVNEYAEERLEEAYTPNDGRIVHTLLDLGMNIHVDDDAPIRLAAKHGDTEMVQFLVEKGANVQARDNEALVLAAKGGDVEVIRLLLKAGADVQARDNGALVLAANSPAVDRGGGCGHVEIIRLLLIAGADVQKGLPTAAREGHLEIAELLLKAGADVHDKDDLASRLAAFNGHLELVRLLLNAGANVHAVRHGFTLRKSKPEATGK